MPWTRSQIIDPEFKYYVMPSWYVARLLVLGGRAGVKDEKGLQYSNGSCYLITITMAFPVPSHLPRSVNQQNKLTQILSKIGETSTSEFTASLAASWIAELDDSIQQTKVCFQWIWIHLSNVISKEQIKSRISSDLPTFESQLASSKSVQTRLQDLARNVDQLSDSVANSEVNKFSNKKTVIRKHCFRQA